MPELGNPRWEMYAQNLFKGLKQLEAYELAGFSASAGNASAMAKKPAIRERVLELQREGELTKGKTTPIPQLPLVPGTNNLSPQARALSEEWLVTQLMNNIQQAQINSKFREANEAIKMLGNYFGGIFDAKNPTDQTKNKDSKNEAVAKTKDEKANLMTKMAEAFRQPDEQTEQED